LIFQRFRPELFLPPMERIFFVGDIHGCSNTFRKLVIDGIGIKKTDRLYCVGDYIDRGGDSKGVVDFILGLRRKNFQIYTLRGNHEQMLLDSEDGEDEFSLWMMNGGELTLKSFRVDSIKELDPAYIDFFRQTRFFIRENDFITVHAGLNFNIEDPLEDKDSMLWIRNFKVNRSYLNDKLLIHGHTPRKREYIISQRFEGAFNLDGGCVYKHTEGMGNLFAMNYYEKELVEVRNID
jgi:serine/threonine protein phosphatase 1